MDYKSIYDAIIDRAKTRTIVGYSERHHVIPRCLGGTDEPSNLVDLTPEEHFVSHLLLVKIYPDETKLLYAVNAMCMPVGGRKARRLYGWMRRRFADTMSVRMAGDGNPSSGSFWITDGVHNKRIRGNIPEGWFRGRTVAPRTVDRLHPTDHPLPSGFRWGRSTGRRWKIEG